MSLLGIASNALNNASVGASTASKNIQNVNTESYAREVATFTTGPGNFVFVDVKRMTDNFTNARYHTSNAQLKFDEAVHRQLSQMNSVVTSIAYDASGEYSNALNKSANEVYQAAIKLSADDSLPNREQLLSSMQTFQDVVANIEYAIEEQKRGMGDLIKQDVTATNNILGSLHDINEQIRSSAESADNSLLNRRDQLLDELSGYLGMQARIGEGGTVDVTTTSGVNLLDKDGPREIGYQHDVELDRYTVTIGKHQASPRELGGEIGGLLTSYDEANRVKAEIGGMYYALMSEINIANQAGFQSDGTAGENLIDLAAPGVRASANNSGAGNLTLDGIDHLAKQPVRFEVTRTNDGYLIKDLNRGTQQLEAGLPFSYGGVDMSESGTIQIGDTFVVDPYNGAGTTSSLTTDHERIALSGAADGGSTNTSNAANLSAVFERGVYNGGFEDMHTFIGTSMSRIGEGAKSAEHRLSVAQSNNESASFMRDQIQGVDMNEENISLIQYQSAYQAASKIIQTQVRLMDALLGSI